MQSGDAPLAPAMIRSAPLYDADQVVGRVEIRQSLRPLLLRTARCGAPNAGAGWGGPPQP